MKAAFPLIIVIALTGCANRTKVTTVTDRTTTVVERIDTIVPIPPNTIRRAVPLHGLMAAPVIIENDAQRIEISYDGETDQLTVEAIAKGRDVPVELERTTTTEETIKQTEKTVTQTVSRLRWFSYGFIACILLLIGLIVLRVAIKKRA